MTEHRAYLCSWKRTRNQFEIWIKDRPAIRGHGSSFARAERAISEAILTKLGDGEAVWEYDRRPPIEQPARKYLSPELLFIVGDDCPDEFGPADRLFSRGSCEACGRALGTRTTVPLSISSIEHGYEGGFTRDRLYHASFFSEKFLQLLSPDERAACAFRQVILPARSRRRFYELITQPKIPFVGVAGLDASGWQCQICGQRYFGVDEPELPMGHFVCRADLPDPLPTCFSVGSPQSPYLSVTAARWSEIVGRPGTKGLLSHPLGVVPEEECDREPGLRKRWGTTCARCTEKPWFRPRDRRVWPIPSLLRHSPMVQWLISAVNEGDVVVIRQPVSLESLISIVEGADCEPPIVFSFRCPDCWKLGRVIVTAEQEDKEVFFELPWE